MVSGASEDDLGRVGDRFQLESAMRRFRVISPEGGRIGAIRTAGPEVLVDDGMSVHVIPAAVQDVAARRDRGKPLIGLVEGQSTDVAAVAIHAMQGVDVPARAKLVAKTTGMAPAARRAEDDPAVGQIVGHQVLVLALGQLTQAGAVGVDLIDVVERVFHCAAREGEDEALGIVGKPGLQHVARGQLALEQVAGCQGPARLLENEKTSSRTRSPAEILHYQMAVRGGHPFDKQELTVLLQGLGQKDMSLQGARAEVKDTLLVKARRRTSGQRGEPFQLRPDRLWRTSSSQQPARPVQVADRCGQVVSRVWQLILLLPLGLNHGPEIQFRCLVRGQRGSTAKRFSNSLRSRAKSAWGEQRSNRSSLVKPTVHEPR